MHNSPYIWYVAGRSGGHIIPALTHAKELLSSDKQLKIGMITTHHHLDRALVHNQQCVSKHVMLPLGNFPRKNILGYPRFCAQFFWSLCITFMTLLRFRPRKIVSMGGYVSIPVAFIAWVLRIPFELFELNVVPGEAVKFLAPFAQRVYICFDQTRTYLPRARCEYAPYPIRFTEHDRISKEKACAQLGIPSGKMVVLILGGSQGSRALNDLAKIVTPLVDCFVIHQTGEHGVAALRQFYGQHGIGAKVFAFSDQMAACYSAADVVIARAGSGTLFELLFFEKKSVIIPLETPTTAHQLDNARALQAEYSHFVTVLRQIDVMDNPMLLVDCIKQFRAIQSGHAQFVHFQR